MAGYDHSSYYTRANVQSAALLRARRPYLVKNTIAGTILFGVVAGVYTYTLKAVGQDEFEDVKVPEAPTQLAQQRNSGATKQ